MRFIVFEKLENNRTSKFIVIILSRFHTISNYEHRVKQYKICTQVK